MGQLTNNAATGDAWQLLSVVGFNDESDAQQYVKNGFKQKGGGSGQPTFQAQLNLQQTTSFDGVPWVVFYYYDVNGANPTLLSITRCHGDLPNLNIGSWGNQFLLTS